MPRIAWIEDADARGQLTELYGVARSQSQRGVVNENSIHPLSGASSAARRERRV